MKKTLEQERVKAAKQFFADKFPKAIRSSLGRARSWLYKWVAWHSSDDPTWREN